MHFFPHFFRAVYMPCFVCLFVVLVFIKQGNDLTCLFLFMLDSCISSSRYVWLILVHIPLYWSMPTRRTPSKMSTYSSMASQGATPGPGSTFTAVPTGECSRSDAGLMQDWCRTDAGVCYRCCFVHFAACLHSYSFLCRSVAVDGINRVSVLQLSHKTEVILQTSSASFLLVRAMFPIQEFSIAQYEHNTMQSDGRLLLTIV